jgi:predicted Zn-dependent protease
MNVGVCDWNFRMSRDRDLNAGAMGYGNIVLNRGIVEYANNEEEVCLVVAHEIGHHAANHVARGHAQPDDRCADRRRGGGGRRRHRGQQSRLRATQSAAQLGATIGRLSYSKEQEREADYMAALILYRAGIDLDKARGLLVTMASGSGRMETTFLDSHPAGPNGSPPGTALPRRSARRTGGCPQRA